LNYDSNLEIKNVSVSFQGLKAIEDVNEKILPKEIMGLIGPNGAGKTTLVNVITGFQNPTNGSVLLNGVVTEKSSAYQLRRKGISRTFQGGRLFREMSVCENVEVAGLGLGLSRKKATQEALELINWIGLSDKANTLAGALPYTDERRVGIARALMQNPKFVLLDEPAAGMSDLECEDLMNLVVDIRDKFDCGVLLIEHNMRVVMQVSERIHVLDTGKTIARGTPDEIKKNPAVIEAYLGKS